MTRAYANRDLIATMDVERDYHRIYQLTVLYDFPKDARLGLNLAFYRIFAIPRIADLLVESGEMLGRPAKRAYDTGLVMYELITSGFDDPRGREMVRLLNRVHRRWPILDEDYRYVLAAFIVVPIRWIDRRGWRRLLPAEREASATFYRELGRRMRIPDPPRTYAEAEQILDSYERKYMAPNDSGRRLMATTQNIIVRKVPRPLRRIAPSITSSLLDEPDLSDALGLPQPRRTLSALLRLMYRTRNAVRRLGSQATDPWFVPGRPVSTVYPRGYQLSEVGPDTSSAEARE